MTGIVCGELTPYKPQMQGYVGINFLGTFTKLVGSLLSTYFAMNRTAVVTPLDFVQIYPIFHTLN